MKLSYYQAFRLIVILDGLRNRLRLPHEVHQCLASRNLSGNCVEVNLPGKPLLHIRVSCHVNPRARTYTIKPFGYPQNQRGRRELVALNHLLATIAACEIHTCRVTPQMNADLTKAVSEARLLLEAK